MGGIQYAYYYLVQNINTDYIHSMYSTTNGMNYSGYLYVLNCFVLFFSIFLHILIISEIS